MSEFIQTLLWVGAAVGAALTIGGLGFAFWRIMKRLDVITEGVLGKPEVVDFSGAIIEPAIPSLQARVSSLEGLVRNDNQEDRVTALEAWREEHTRDAVSMKNKMLDHILSQSRGK